MSLFEVISTNNASYFLLNTSNSPLALKCVQLKDNVYLFGAKQEIIDKMKNELVEELKEVLYSAAEKISSKSK